MAALSLLRSAFSRSVAPRLPVRQAFMSHDIAQARLRLNGIRSFSEATNVTTATEKSADDKESADDKKATAPVPKPQLSYKEFMDRASRQVYLTLPKGHDTAAAKSILTEFGEIKALKFMQLKPKTAEEGGSEGAKMEGTLEESKESPSNESSDVLTMLVEFAEAATASKVLSSESIDMGNGVLLKPSAPHALKNKREQKNRKSTSNYERKPHPDIGLTVHVSAFNHRDLTEANVREAFASLNVNVVGDVIFPTPKEESSSKEGESAEELQEDAKPKSLPRFCFVKLASKEEVDTVVKAQSHDKNRIIFSLPMGAMNEEEKAAALDARKTLLSKYVEEINLARAERYKKMKDRKDSQRTGGQRKRQAASERSPPNQECQVLLVSDGFKPWDRTLVNLRMQSYGPVKSIIVPKDQQKICFVEFEEKEVATEVASGGILEFEDGTSVNVRLNGEGRVHQRNRDRDNSQERSSRGFGNRSERSPRRGGDRAASLGDRRDGGRSSRRERNDRLDDFHTRAGMHKGPDAEQVLRNQQRQQRQQGARRDKALAAATEAHVKMMKDFAGVVGAKHASEGDEETKEIYAFYSSALAKIQSNGALSDESKVRVSDLLGKNLGIGMDNEAIIADGFVEKLNKKTDLFS